MNYIFSVQQVDPVLNKILLAAPNRTLLFGSIGNFLAANELSEPKLKTYYWIGESIALTKNAHNASQNAEKSSCISLWQNRKQFEYRY